MTDTSMKNVALTIDGQSINVPEGTTIFDAAALTGISIPALCHRPGLRPVGVCRTCVVEVEGARVLQASCVRQVEDGMIVYTDTERVRAVRKTIVELLLAITARPVTRVTLNIRTNSLHWRRKSGLVNPDSRHPVVNIPRIRHPKSSWLITAHASCVIDAFVPVMKYSATT